jgi:uncharacterized protein (TIGR03437 family)
MITQSLSARNIFVTSGDPASSSLSVFTTDPLLSAGNITAPIGATQVFAGPGGKYYVIGRTASEGVGVLTGTFPTLQLTTRLAFPAAPTAAALSPDGRRLIVIYPGGAQVIDTTSDTVLPGSAALNVGASPAAVAISTDSHKAFVLSPDLQKLIGINLDSATVSGDVSTTYAATSVTVSPNSLVYVTVQNAIYEIDPQSLQIRFTYALSGSPGAVAFTPDGRIGISPNGSLVTGKSAFYLDTVRKTATDLPPVGAVFSKIVVADNNTAYAYSNQNNRVYLIILTSPQTPGLLSVPGVVLENARDIVLSNEGPSAKNLFVLTTGGLYRISRSDNTVVGPVAATPGALSFAGPAATGAAANLLTINTTQTVAPGGTTLPLIVRAVDLNGVPLANVSVQFTSDATATLSPGTATTDLLGYAQTTATIATTAATGVVTVNATAGGVVVPFTLNIATGTPGGGPGGGPTPGGLQILSGQGQVTGVSFPIQQPLTVIVLDAAGNPVPGVPITWTIAQGTGALGSVDVATNDKGIATASYAEFLVPFGVPYNQAVIAASTGAETVNFIVTTVPRLPNGSPGEATYSLRAPQTRAIAARVGETVTGAIQFAVGSLLGPAIPNVGLRIANDDPNGATATCRGGIPLSDESGLVTCDLIAGGKIGESTIRVIVGEKVQVPMLLQVSAGLPNTVRITGGNNQTGNAGQLLPQTLVIEVTDAGGNLLPNADVAWQVVTPGTATLSNAQAKTDNGGRATARVTLGQQPGVIQINARSGTGAATFSFTVNLNAATMTINGGADQSAVVGTQFSPVSVKVVDAQNRPVQGASVGFQVVSGPATAPATAVSDANGIAAVTVTAGQTPGAVVLRATLGNLTQTINLTVRTPGPAITASSFVNAADYQPGISPGTIAVITGSGIAPTVQGTVTPTNIVGPLPTTLAGVEVLFNGVSSPIFAVSNISGKESVIVQVPFETTPGAASVTIRTSGGGSTTVPNVQVQTAKPGIFQYQDVNGKQYGVALRPDGSYVSSTNPARRGDIIRVFATGLGQTSPAAATNRVGVRDQTVLANVISGINNEGVRTVSAKMAEGSVGVYIVEMEIPQTATTGDSRPLALAIAGPDGAPVFGGSAIPIQ